MPTTTNRTDIHSPTNMDPEAYEYLWTFDNAQPGFLIGVDMDWWRSITNFDPALADRSIHQCHHCGARIRYGAILRHIPSGYAVVVGETCLDNRFSLQSKAEFDRLRKAAALDRQKQRIKTAALEFLAENTDGDVNLALNKDTNLEETFGLEGFGLSVVTDIRNKLFTYGSLSDKQTAFVQRLIDEAATRKANAARIAAERAAEVRIPAPVGRTTFEGVVVSRKERETDFGLVWKLTVKVETEDGIFLVWVSEPSSIECRRGDKVAMTATLKPSNDPSFAFGSRPSKALVVSEATDAENDALADALD